jgi:hypothetical protein
MLPYERRGRNQGDSIANDLKKGVPPMENFPSEEGTLQERLVPVLQDAWQRDPLLRPTMREFSSNLKATGSESLESVPQGPSGEAVDSGTRSFDAGEKSTDPEISSRLFQNVIVDEVSHLGILNSECVCEYITRPAAPRCSPLLAPEPSGLFPAFWGESVDRSKPNPREEPKAGPRHGFLRSLVGYSGGDSTASVYRMLNPDHLDEPFGSSQGIRPQKRKRDEAQEFVEPSVRPRRGSTSISATTTARLSAINLDPKRFYNRRGDQRLSDGTITRQESKHEYALAFVGFPDVGDGYANLEGTRLDQSGQPFFFRTYSDRIRELKRRMELESNRGRWP